MDNQECYRALGLKPGASLADVEAAYRELAQLLRPELFEGKPTMLRRARDEMAKINVAYGTICAARLVEPCPRPAPGSGRDENSPNDRSRIEPLNLDDVLPLPFGMGGRGEGPVHGELQRPREDGAGDGPFGKPFEVASCGGMKLNWVGSGHFLMGSPDSESGRSGDEGPQTRVTLGPFWLGKYAVTQEEWKPLAKDVNDLLPAPSYFRGSRFPVEQVSWDDCQDWLKRLNQLEANRLPLGYCYRLPTEAEWEFACRAGTGTRYSFGDGDNQLGYHAWYSANCGNTTHPVGEKEPNAWGFHDMHGNVWEWCRDFYADKLPGGRVTDPKGPGFGWRRVVRGGSWGFGAERCRSASRLAADASCRIRSFGFRLALAPRIFSGTRSRVSSWPEFSIGVARFEN